MSLILNIETSTDVCSVALFNKQQLVDSRENKEGKSHASLVTVFIEEIFQSNNLDITQLSAVSVSMGPGSYTGLRIGISVAKGLCYGSGIPLIAVPTLQIITRAYLETLKKQNTDISPNSLLCPMIDARRQEVYCSLYDPNENIIEKTNARIIDEQSFSTYLNHTKIYFFGNGSDKCRQLINHPNAFFVKGIYPSATVMAPISQLYFETGKFEDTAYFEPFYLKDFVATTPKNKVLN
jgi:tRNA threonylcarbamoyladenosine biosynthesis protein TsaB